MSEDDKQPEKDVPESAKTISSFKLRRESPVVAVTEGLGKVYLSHLRVKDIEGISKGEDERARGLTIISALTDVSDTADERIGLSDEDFAKLSPSDLDKLAIEIINIHNWSSNDMDIDPVARLGRAHDQYLKDAIKPISEAIEHARVQLAEPMKQLKDVLSDTTQKLFSENLGISTRLRDVLAGSDWVEQFQKEQKAREAMFRSISVASGMDSVANQYLRKEQEAREAMLKGISAAAEMDSVANQHLRKKQEAHEAMLKGISAASGIDSIDSVAGQYLHKEQEAREAMLKGFSGASEFDSLGKKGGGVNQLYDYTPLPAGAGTMEGLRRNEELHISPPPLMTPHMNFATTPVGRVATSVEEISNKTDTLVELHRSTLDELARMSQLLSTAVPEFMAKIQVDRDAATSMQSVAWDNLRVAKNAIFFSVGVGVLAMLQAWWFNSQNDLQQTRMEKLVAHQTDSLDKLIEQNSGELARLNEHILRLEQQLIKDSESQKKSAMAK